MKVVLMTSEGCSTGEDFHYGECNKLSPGAPMDEEDFEFDFLLSFFLSPDGLTDGEDFE